MAAARSSPPVLPDGFVAAPAPARGERVVVGLSGGVDSTVCAALLRDAGCEVVAVTTRNFCLGEPPFDLADATGSCCSEEAVVAARRTAADLGVEHVVLDVADDFVPVVVDDFVREYQRGRTPSPCVRCNTHVRFPRLTALARAVGARRVATGHYARRIEGRGEHWVARGADPEKDQSYFLHRLPSEELAAIVMPLGGLVKDEVRELARRRGLVVAGTPDSQELCFVPDGDRRRLLAEGARPGEVVDTAGNVLGVHPGIGYFTLGQRRGLGLGGGAARFVVALDPDRDRVVVGREEDLERDRLRIADVVLRDPLAGAPGLRARTRLRHPGLPVETLRPAEDEWIVDLGAPDRAPSPGQSVVLYRGDLVVGGGVLVAAASRRNGP